MRIAKAIKAAGWRLLYSKWRPMPVENEGYTILLMFPGDLPVFLDIAMAVCARQNPEHLAEVLVIPDKMHRYYGTHWESIRKQWPRGPIRLVRLRPFEQRFAGFRNSPHTYCWLQLIRGMEQARSTHALWHDADLFILNRNLLKEQYETCAARKMAFFGLDPAAPYARPWFEARGIHHIVASYEMMMDVEWFRRFAPWEHRGHEMKVNGEWHVGDITYRSQIRTPPERCGWQNRDDDFVHFSYVIGMYRRFQNSRGVYEDKGFKVLLVRLLIDAFDRSGWSYEAPQIRELAKGLKDPTSRVTYLQTETRREYPEFRQKLERLLTSGLFDGAVVSSLRAGIRPFDEAFARQKSPTA